MALTLNSDAASLVEGTYDWDPAGGEYTFSFGTVAVDASYTDGSIGPEGDYFSLTTDGTVWVTETLLGDLVIDFEMDTGNAEETVRVEGHIRATPYLDDYPL